MRQIIAVVLMLVLSGCAVGPDFVRPDAPTVDSYTGKPQSQATAEGLVQSFEVGHDIAADWWRLFGNTDLDEAVSTALDGNRNLQGAQARLRQSQELLTAGYGVFFPQLDASLGFSRQKFSSSRFGGGFGSSIFKLYSASLAVTYDLDLFGGNRRQVEGLAAEADLSEAQLRATYLTLLGNVVNTVIARAAYRAKIEATEQIVELERQQVHLATTKLEAGILAKTEVLSLRTRLAATEATLPPLRQGLEHSDHLLASLSGRLPAEASPVEVALDDLVLPEELPLSLPSDLVRQRPDILVAEARLHGASADIGVATAALFPSITLNGNYGQESTRAGDLFKDISNVWNWGGTLSQPLFHGRSLWFRRRAAEEAFRAALADYHQTVLDAFVEVADALRALTHDAEALQARSAALDSSSSNLELVRSNYKAGIASYLEVLSADLQYQQARIGHIDSRAQRLQDTALLFTALGGGWWNRPADKPAPDGAPASPAH